MRHLGMTMAATLLSAALVHAQAPGAPAPQSPQAPPQAQAPQAPPQAPPVAPQAPQVPGQVPPAPPAAPPVAGAPSALDMHLMNWERSMGSVKNFHVEIAMTKKDAVFQREKKYKGVVLCMKPNYAILRLENLGDATKQDYEAYICNGKSVFQYSGVEKTITEYKIPNAAANPGAGTDNLMLDFLSGLRADDAKKRFDISVFKEDQHYVYLDIKPRFAKDAQDFVQLRMALFGPNTKVAYLPCQVLKTDPKGDTELWVFSNHQVNLPGIEPNVFEFKPVPGFKIQQAPPVQQAPPQRPGQPAPNVQGAGAVRPNAPQ